MNPIATCLWFDTQAAEAAEFYVGIFKQSRMIDTFYNPEGGPHPAGTVLTVSFVLNGNEFLALNGGPNYRFSPAISLVVSCDTQEELDDYWEKLIDGGQEVQCGWLTDRFGVSWQIVPKPFIEMLKSPDRAAVQRAFSAMLPMKKLDLAALEKAFKAV